MELQEYLVYLNLSLGMCLLILVIAEHFKSLVRANSKISSFWLLTSCLSVEAGYALKVRHVGYD